MKLFPILFALLAFSAPASAEIPVEIQGVWVPDIEETLKLMAGKDMETIDFMRDRYLPGFKKNNQRYANHQHQRQERTKSEYFPERSARHNYSVAFNWSSRR